MFQRFSIFTRLIILAGVLIFALLLNTMMGWLGFRTASTGLDEVYIGSINEISTLMAIKSHYRVEIIATTQKLRDELISWREGEELIRNGLSKIDTTLERYLQRSILNSENIENTHSQRIMDERLNQQARAIRPSLDRLLNIVREQNKEELNAFGIKELYPLIEPVVQTIDQIIDGYVNETVSDYKAAKSILAFYQPLIFITLISALILSFIVTWLITISITQPLKKAVEAIHQVSIGDLKSIDYPNHSSTDEISLLFEAMHKMVRAEKRLTEVLSELSAGELNLQVEPRSDKDIVAKSLNEMINSSKKMSEALTELTNGNLEISVKPRSDRDALGLALLSMTNKLRQIIGSLQSEVIALNDSSQEIVNSVSQVAIGSSETATAVTETTTTVEELKQTAQVSAEKAKDVLASAEDTLRVVKESEKSLQSTIYDMNQINEKMRSISEGIIKLSELSQTIGEIIDTVNDLAEQSNLLAVNAAIEAAKAGEQGKGFGVVAQEIRTLAEQSKAATVQVRSILNDIQNATSAAVLATEQGSKAVEKGVDQSSQTNESMRILVTSMGHVTQSANQISISSQQQFVGVDQVNIAINNIHEATRQHIENMQTIENTVKAFNAIGQTLKQIIDQYTLTGIHKNN